MFNSAFLEESGNGKLRHEEQLLREEFERRGIPVILYTAKRIQRRQLPLSADTFIAGDMDAMQGAMRQLKIEVPAPFDYPKCLWPFILRQIWTSTLGDIEREIADGTRRPVFVKPAKRQKSFTGRAFASWEDFREIGSASRGQEVWCSQLVEWVSEYRIYVIGAQIVSVDRYAGDSKVPLDLDFVREAVRVFRISGDAPAAYGIDFGVLKSGRTALVEVNDGYALGAYQITGTAYTDLLIARWEELVSKMEAII